MKMNISLLEESTLYYLYQRSGLRNVIQYLNEELLYAKTRRCSTVIFPSSPKQFNSVIRGRKLFSKARYQLPFASFIEAASRDECARVLGPLSGKLYDRDKLLTTLESFFIETSADCDTVYS